MSVINDEFKSVNARYKIKLSDAIRLKESDGVMII